MGQTSRLQGGVYTLKEICGERGGLEVLKSRYIYSIYYIIIPYFLRFLEGLRTSTGLQIRLEVVEVWANSLIKSTI